MLVSGVFIAVAQVFHNGPCEKIHFLQDHAEAAAKVCLFNLVDVYSVVSYLAVVKIIKAIDEVCDGSFASPGRADERNLLTGLSLESNVVKDSFAGDIGEVYMVENNASLELCVGESAVAMGMFPRPEAGVLRGFCDDTILFPGIDKCYITVVSLRCFVHELEYSGSTGERCDNRVELV